MIQIIAGRRIFNRFQRARITVIDQQIVRPNDHLELQPFRQLNRSGVACRQVQLKDVRLGEDRGKDQEKHQDHHHVDHRHDVQIIAPLVIAGVIASDEARGF